MKKSVFHDHLAFLYGTERADELTTRLLEMLTRFQAQNPHLARADSSRFDEQDTILITYGDMVQAAGETPLQTLADFLERYLRGRVNTIHLLPFYPYSSDDGFSVIDYRRVNPALGSWADITRFQTHFRLMFDAVVNHISAQSDWFQRFLRGEPAYQNYFTVVAPGTDLSAVFRPRVLPLLTEVETTRGRELVWTTFSADQIDLNFANPELLLEILAVLLFYVGQGASFIRLDAIAFIGKEIGTNCLHLPQTHRLIQLMRSMLDAVAPGVVLITETNVLHQENISYLGNGHNEAQMVYNFSLPPLTLHALHTGNAVTLSQWADTLLLPSDEVTFFNFLASHDGIGLTPARGILPETAMIALAERVQRLGGFVSYRHNPDGSQTPYELNINYLDALGDPDAPHEDTRLMAKRFLVAQAIMLALRGVPGIYFHSLFGSRGWSEGVKVSGRNRTINRQKLQRQPLEAELADPLGLRHTIFSGFLNLLQQRRTHPAFHPHGGQKLLDIHPALLALLRASPDGRTSILCLHNVSAQAHPLVFIWPEQKSPGRLMDLLSQEIFTTTGNSVALTIQPYQVLWLKPAQVER
ncbi:MAG: sugar phosphorylase [Candidatus Promineifilaceae bacterium]